MVRWSFIIVCSVLLLAISSVGVATAENISLSSSSPYQGQALTVTGDAVKNDTTYELWKVDSVDDQYPPNVTESTFVRPIMSNSSGDIHISTTNLSPADYFVRGDGLPSQPEWDDTFEVRVQVLTANFETTEIEPGLGTKLDIESNRGEYAIDISSSELNKSDLITTFTEEGGFELATDQPAGATIRLEELRDPTNPAIFSDSLSDGKYTFEFNATDTTANHTETITIDQESGANISITPTHTSVAAGDQVGFSVTISGANRGVGGYSFNLSLSNNTLANISGISLDGASQNDIDNEVNITEDMATVDVDETSTSKLQSEKLLGFSVDSKEEDVSKFSINISDVEVMSGKNKSYSVSTVESPEVIIRSPKRINTEAEGTVWKGQIAVEDADHITPDTIYDLRLATEFEDSQVSASSSVQEMYSSSDGQIKIESDSLGEGRYFLTGGGFDSAAETNITDTFQVRTQTLDANFASNSVEHDGQAGLVFNSNRTQYDVVVSSDKFSEDRLIEAFVTNGTFDLVDKFSGADNQIMIAVPSSGTDIVDFTALGSGTHTFSIKTPVTSGVGTTRVSIDVKKKNNGNDNGDSETDNSGSDSEGSSGGSSGGSGGGGSGGGGVGGGSGDSSTGPPTPEQVDNTLSLVEPKDSTTLTADAGGEGAESGTTGGDSSGTSVQDVTFVNANSQSVEVTDYGSPPETVKEDVIDSIAADNDEIGAPTAPTDDATDSSDSDSDEDSGDGTTTGRDGGDSESPEANVIQLAKVEPAQEIPDEAQAEVVFSVDRDKVKNPNSLTVYKDAYVFESQEEQWVEAETTVSEVTDESVEVTAVVDSFSLFAVMEVDGRNAEPEVSPDTNGTSEDTQTEDKTPGFGLGSMIIVIIVLGMSIGSRSYRSH